MTYQSGRNILVAYKAENTPGTLAGASGGKVFRPNSGSLNLSRDTIGSNENRRDGMMTRARLGQKNVAGSYAGDISIGSYDDFIEATLRGTFDSALVVTEATASLGSITTTTSTIVGGAGSWITAGIRVGDVIRITGHSTTANNSKNLLVTGVTASTITVAGTPLTLNATPDTAFTVTRPKRVLNGTTPRAFTVEEYEIDIDASEVFKFCRVGQMQLQLQPNGQGIITFSLVGQDMEVMTSGSAPYFSSPTATTSIGMTAVEASLLLGGTQVLDFTSLDLTINLSAAGQPVVGSNVTPEIFTNLSNITGSVTALRSDLARVQNFLAEDQLSLHLVFTENESEPKDFCSFFLGNIALGAVTKSELGSDNGRTQTMPLNVGVDERGGAYDLTMLKYQTSAS